jgi:hypothetical protein
VTFEIAKFIEGRSFLHVKLGKENGQKLRKEIKRLKKVRSEKPNVWLHEVADVWLLKGNFHFN